VKQMYQNMVKSDLVSGGHIRPGPDMAGYKYMAGFRPGPDMISGATLLERHEYQILSCHPLAVKHKKTRWFATANCRSLHLYRKSASSLSVTFTFDFKI